jgi:dipeptidyl-peptidase-3
MNPIGINIPNYDEIRLNKGFKNVSLSNSMNAFTVNAAKFPFLTEDVLPSFVALLPKVSVLAVASHELYGHGSGTLFTESDIAKQIPDLLFPGRFVSTFYAPGETFQTVFSGFGASYEECRAEVSSLHLAFKDEVLDMYGIAPGDRLAFKVVALLSMLHGGIKTLFLYSPEVARWGQAHSRARFAIVRAVIMWSAGAVSVKKIGDSYKILLDQGKFQGVVDAIELLLKHLNYYKAARLPDQAREFYGALTAIDDFWLDVRKQAIATKLPRGVITGATLVKGEDGEYALARQGGETLTALDTALAAVQSTKISLE